MNTDLIREIDALIEASREELAIDTIKLVNIKSVKSDPLPGAPFGEGTKQVLDHMLNAGRNAGFDTKDYRVGVISLALKDGVPDLGIWTHGDVVPEGDGWKFAPYHAVEYNGCIIGRGATDNKGQLAAMFHLFKIFQRLNIELKYNPAIYVGSNEESGMEDVKSFLKNFQPPRLSLVPDSGFPVGYGGRGSAKITIRSKAPLHRAILLSEGKKITKVCTELLESNLAEASDREITEFLNMISQDTSGTLFGLNIYSEAMKRSLSVTPKTISMNDNGCVELLLDIRYPIELTYETIVERVEHVCQENGFRISHAETWSSPYLLDPNTELIRRLTKIANDVTGDLAEPYALGGATYAHILPNALVYGTDGNLPPDDFPKDRGHAHGVDEAVSLDRLQRAMKIYARALLELNDMEW